MTFTNIAHAHNYRKIAVLLLLAFITLSFVSISNAPSFSTTLSGSQWLPKKNFNDKVEVICQRHTTHTAALLARGKIKVKAFFKNPLLSFLLPALTSSVSGIMPGTSFSSIAIKPSYYSFVFRYTPF